MRIDSLNLPGRAGECLAVSLVWTRQQKVNEELKIKKDGMEAGYNLRVSKTDIIILGFREK